MPNALPVDIFIPHSAADADWVEDWLTPADPWLEFAGMWVDEPKWETFQAEIAAYRKSIDKQTHPF